MEQNMNKLPSLNNIKRYKQNPFMIELNGKMYLQPRTNTIIARGKAVIDEFTGEVIERGVLIGRRKIVDKSQFSKLYASEISLLFELSKTAINIFLYLSQHMDYENKAYFSYTQEYKEVGYKSHKLPLKGLRELISKNIIAPSHMTNVWWLNPTIICKGERFAKYTEYIVDNNIKDEKNIVPNKQIEAVKQMDENTQKQYRIADNSEIVTTSNNEKINAKKVLYNRLED